MTTARQDTILAITPRIGSSLSIPSSLFIIMEVIGDHRKGKGNPIQRAVLGMSVVDVLASSAWWLSTWAIPKGTSQLARGNVASCNYQGFLLQLAIGAPLYNCSLALYYVLVIRYNWTNQQLAKIERYVHGTILLFTIGTSIAGLPTDMYNQVGAVCWVVGSPEGCGNSSGTPSDVPCDRGDWAWIFGIVLFYGPLWLCVALTMIAMAVIYCQVRNTFGQARKWTFGAQSTNSTQFEREGSNIHQSTLGNLDSSRGADHQITTQASNGWRRVSLDGRLSLFSVFRPSVSGARDVHESAAMAAASVEGDGGDESQHREDCAAPNTNVPRSNAATGTTNDWRTQHRTQSSLRQERRRASKQTMFAVQAILYSGSFIITWMPSTIWSVATWFNKGGFSLNMAAAVCEPLQGFWNMLIFIRRRKGSQEKLKYVFCCGQSFCTGCTEKLFPQSNGMSSQFSDSQRYSEMRKASMEAKGSLGQICSAQEEPEKSAPFDTEPSTIDDGDIPEEHSEQFHAQSS